MHTYSDNNVFTEKNLEKKHISQNILFDTDLFKIFCNFYFIYATLYYITALTTKVNGTADCSI